MGELLGQGGPICPTPECEVEGAPDVEALISEAIRGVEDSVGSLLPEERTCEPHPTQQAVDSLTQNPTFLVPRYACMPNLLPAPPEGGCEDHETQRLVDEAAGVSGADFCVPDVAPAPPCPDCVVDYAQSAAEEATEPIVRELPCATASCAQEEARKRAEPVQVLLCIDGPGRPDEKLARFQACYPLRPEVVDQVSGDVLVLLAQIVDTVPCEEPCVDVDPIGTIDANRRWVVGFVEQAGADVERYRAEAMTFAADLLACPTCPIEPFEPTLDYLREYVGGQLEGAKGLLEESEAGVALLRSKVDPWMESVESMAETDPECGEEEDDECGTELHDYIVWNVAGSAQRAARDVLDCIGCVEPPDPGVILRFVEDANAIVLGLADLAQEVVRGNDPNGAICAYLTELPLQIGSVLIASCDDEDTGTAQAPE